MKAYTDPEFHRLTARVKACPDCLPFSGQLCEPHLEEAEELIREPLWEL